MVKKVPSKRARRAASAPAGNSLRQSAQQIWLNGLGAFAKAQESGNKVFETLVEEGRSLKQRTRSLAEDKVGLVTAKATNTWDKLEGAFETRVAQALQGLGVPSRHDIEALSDRVAQLSEAVEALGGKPARKAKSTVKATVKASVKATPKTAARTTTTTPAKAAPAKASAAKASSAKTVRPVARKASVKSAVKAAVKASAKAASTPTSTSRRAAPAVTTSAGEAAAA
jgi:poly(hydroxyalkanoate) granule-associated protein